MNQFFFIILILVSNAILAQDCSKLFVDLKKGTINDVKPTASHHEIKMTIPCSDGETEDGTNYYDGGGVWFLNRDFFYYTEQKYIRIGKNFKGLFNIPILGISKNIAIEKLGLGKPIKIEGNEDFFYQYIYLETKYGCLKLKIENNSGNVIEIRMYHVHAFQVPFRS